MKTVIAADAQIIETASEQKALQVAELKPLFDYLGTDSYNEDRFKEEARTHICQTGLHAFEAGVRLSVLKAKMPYGTFRAFCGSIPDAREDVPARAGSSTRAPDLPNHPFTQRPSHQPDPALAIAQPHRS